MKYKNAILNIGSLFGSIFTTYEVYNIAKTQNEINNIKLNNSLIQNEIINNLQEIAYHNTELETNLKILGDIQETL